MNDMLREGFRYSAWATKTLIAVCQDLSTEDLNRPGRGYGSILDTLHHVIACDAGYVGTLTGGRPTWVDEARVSDSLDELETHIDETLQAWETFLSEPADADRLLLLDEGTYACHASVVLVQALHHANAHREQIRANLRDLDVPPPDVQPWAYALETGRAEWRRKESQEG